MATSPSVTVMFLCKSVASDLETEKKITVKMLKKKQYHISFWNEGYSFSYFFEIDLH